MGSELGRGAEFDGGCVGLVWGTELRMGGGVWGGIAGHGGAGFGAGGGASYLSFLPSRAVCRKSLRSRRQKSTMFMAVMIAMPTLPSV